MGIIFNKIENDIRRSNLEETQYGVIHGKDKVKINKQEDKDKEKQKTSKKKKYKKVKKYNKNKTIDTETRGNFIDVKK